MLRNIRKSVKSLGMQLLLVLLVLSFVTFYGYSSTSGCNPSAVAKVNGHLIQLDEYQAQMRMELENYRRLLNRDIDPSMMGFLQQNILNNMINRELLSVEASELGAGVSDDELRDEIQKQFADPESGEFDHERYKNIVMSYLKSTPGRYEDQVRRDLLADKYRRIMQSAAKVSDDEIEALVRFQNRRVNLQFITIDPNKIAPPKDPSEEAMQEYYQSHLGDFQTEEKRRLEIAIFSKKDFGGDKETNKEALFNKMSIEAEKLVARAKSNPDKPLNDLVVGMPATVSVTPFLEKDGSIKGTADSAVILGNAFNLNQGDVSEPIRGFVSGNVYVARVDSLQPSVPEPFDKVRGVVLLNLVEQRKGEIAEETANKIIEDLKSGKDIAKVAEAYTLPLDETGFFKLEGTRSIPQIGFSEQLSDEVKKLSFQGTGPDTVAKRPHQVTGSFYVVRGKDFKPVGEEELKDLVALEKNQQLQRRRREVVGAWTDKVRKIAEESGNVQVFSRQGSDES